MDTLLFGTAGIPNSCEGNTMDGIAKVRELNLDAMELEFVHSVNIKQDKAPLVKKAAKDNNIVLTCHAPFFINLNSMEDKKIEASKNRILSSARILDQCGGYSCCFHPGFYQKSTKEQTFDKILHHMKDLVKRAQDEGIGVWIRPETTGKPSQFGDVQELLSISSELEQVMPTIDFSHLHARTNGNCNTYEDFSSILSLVEKKLGRKGLNNMHAHVAGIAYGEKGEKNHLNLKDSDFNYQALMKALRDFKVKGVLICESPNIEIDAQLMQKEYKG